MGYLGTKPANSPLTSELIPNSIITNAKINDVAAAKLTGQVADANAPSGSVIQVVQAVKTDVFSSSSTTFTDITGLSATITPTNTANKILVMVGITAGSTPVNSLFQFRLMRNSTAVFVGDARSQYTSVSIGGGRGVYDTNGANSFPLNYLDSPSTTSAVTYKMQGYVENSGHIFRINATGADTANSIWSFTSASSIILMEIAA
jgi:hypothetical protein